MFKAKTLKFSIISAFIFFSYFPSFAFQIICPDKIETKQSLTSKTIETWQKMTDTFNGLQNFDHLALYDGHPNEGASLVPDNENASKNAFWTFEENNDRSIWVACHYRQSIVRLIRELSRSVKKCIYKSLPKQNSTTLLECT